MYPSECNEEKHLFQQCPFFFFLMTRPPPRSTRRSSDLHPHEHDLRGVPGHHVRRLGAADRDRKSTRLNSSHVSISYAVFCLKKKRNKLLMSIDKRHHLNAN